MLKFLRSFEKKDSIKEFIYKWIKKKNSGIDGPICLPDKLNCKEMEDSDFAKKVCVYFEQMNKDGLLSIAKAENYCLTEKGYHEICE